ncbi:MAG: hypothetical protein ACYSUX_06555 [Planctomycetota bacterium]|jgi:hypothetical protein
MMILKVIEMYLWEKKIDVERCDEGIETNRRIMRDGKIYLIR